MTRKSTMMAVATILVLAIGGRAAAQAPVPAEAPPADLAADEFVDSRGCAFTRVTVGARVEWVPRVGPDREPLCGLPPTQVAHAAGRGAEPPAPDIGRHPVRRPSIRMAHAPRSPAVIRGVTRPSRPTAAVAPRGVAAVSGPGDVTISGPAEVLLPATLGRDEVRLRAGCDAVVRAASRHRTVTGGRCRPAERPPPEIVHGARSPRQPSRSAVLLVRVDRPSVPSGYSVAWTDGRLNPYRGIRTETGEAETRMIWTDTVPRRLISADNRAAAQGSASGP